MPARRSLGGTFQDLNRLREILQILAKYGFAFLVDQLNLGGYLPKRRRAKTRGEHGRSTPERVRHMLAELGPTFVKFGQALSTRPDLIPPAYVKELSKLQDRVPPVSFEQARKVLREELGQAPEKIFKQFTRKTLAAASVAQVHRAVTRDGRQVAVKVQRPGLKKTVDSDLEILRQLAHAWENFGGPELPRRPLELVEEFETLIRAELDFLNEARHQRRFRANFKDREGYIFPAIDLELSTPRCLVMEYRPGDKLDDLPDGVEAEERRRLARRLLEGYVVMALEDQFFHADPHPGNFLRDAEGNLVFLDAGQVGRLDNETVAAFTDMLMALVDRDTDAVVEAYLTLGTAEEALDRRQLKKEVGVFLEQYYDLPLEKIRFGDSLQALVQLSLKHRIQLPRDFVILAKTFLGAEGLARRLDPKLNLVATVQPAAKRILRRRYDPRHVAKELARGAKEMERFVVGLPRLLQELLDKLRRGRLKIEFQHEGLEDLQHSLERASNRLAFALIVAALIVGSSLLLFSRLEPLWGDVSILGLAGFMLAGVLGIWLIIGILRSGRLR